MDVVVSMMPSKRRKVYHRPNCVYVEKMKPGNRMMISENWQLASGFAAVSIVVVCVAKFERKK